MKPPKFNMNMNIDYFPEKNFLSYRRDLLKTINISSIKSSFLGLRELSASLGKLKTDSNSLNDLILVLENSKKNKNTTEPNEKSEIFQKTVIENSTKKIIDLKKKPENMNILESEVLEIQKKNYEKDANLLNNLEQYIHENIKEIKDFKNLFGRENASSNQVDPKISYNPQNIENSDMGEKEKLSEKLLKMQQKSKENEINVLIQKVSDFQKKEGLLTEEIVSENSTRNRITNLLTRSLYFDETIIGNITELDEKNIDYDQINLYIKFLMIDLDKFIFFDTGIDSIHLEIPHNQVSSISLILNNIKLNHMTEHENFNHNKFSGFMINYWEGKELKAIILKNKSSFEQKKIDIILFMSQLMNSFRSKSIIYKTIRSNADLNNNNSNYNINRINSEVCTKEELINLTPTSNKMKESIIKHKKTIQFLLPEPILIEKTNEDTENKKKKILAKLEEFDQKDHIRKSVKLNNANYKNQTAKLKLMNGFAFKVKKKFSKSEEIYIVLDTSRSEYFFYLSTLNNSVKKKIISLNETFKIEKWNSNENEETFFGVNLMTKDSFIELQASEEKNMESFFECCQNILNYKKQI